MDNDSIQKAGSVKISELKLISSNNTVWDLTEFLIELNMFEDIYGSTISGEILLQDAFGLVSNYTLNGTEFIQIQLQLIGYRPFS